MQFHMYKCFRWCAQYISIVHLRTTFSPHTHSLTHKHVCNTLKDFQAASTILCTVDLYYFIHCALCRVLVIKFSKAIAQFRTQLEHTHKTQMIFTCYFFLAHDFRDFFFSDFVSWKARHHHINSNLQNVKCKIRFLGVFYCA